MFLYFICVKYTPAAIATNKTNTANGFKPPFDLTNAPFFLAKTDGAFGSYYPE